MSQRPRKIGLFIAVAAAALVLGVAARFVVDYMTGERTAARSGSGGTSGIVTTSGSARIGGPFALTDHRGRAVKEKDFRGRFLFLYFGYTFCPDICPTELQAMSDALDTDGDLARRVRPVFITVDPERDTVRVMADYVGNFHPQFVGLTGTPEQVAAAAKVFGIYFAKVRSRGAPDDGAAGDYLMNHSSYIYLMNPEGGFSAAFRPGTSGETMATRIRKEIAAYSEKTGGK